MCGSKWMNQSFVPDRFQSSTGLIRLLFQIHREEIIWKLECTRRLWWNICIDGVNEPRLA